MNFIEYFFWLLEVGLWDCGLSIVEVCYVINFLIGLWIDRSNKKFVEDFKIFLFGF